MKLILFILLLLFSKAGKSQSSYSGLLGKYPITLVLYHYSDRVSLAYYTYDKYDSPITINGSLKKGELKLFEKDMFGEKTHKFCIFTQTGQGPFSSVYSFHVGS